MNAELLSKLSMPIPVEEIQWKPQTIDAENRRALMVAYVDARWVAQRLDEATEGAWSFTTEVVVSTEEHVVIKGTLTIDNYTKEDMGEYRKQGAKDSIEMYKAAVSDALKRAAVMFGVGRELYSLPISWVDWDVQRRRPAPGAMDKLDAMIARGRSQPEEEDRVVDLSPLQHLVDQLNAIYHMTYNVGQVVVSICGTNIPDDLETLKPLIGKWYRKEAIAQVASSLGIDEYDVDKVIAFMEEKAPGKTVGDLKKQYAAITEYFKG